MSVRGQADASSLWVSSKSENGWVHYLATSFLPTEIYLQLIMVNPWLKCNNADPKKSYQLFEKLITFKKGFPTHLEAADDNVSRTHCKMRSHLTPHHLDRAAALCIDAAHNSQWTDECMVLEFALVESCITTRLAVHHWTLWKWLCIVMKKNIM